MSRIPTLRPVSLTDARTLRPSAYNPRRADEARLRLVQLSLRKLGWLLPVYADADGEILSGHQRTRVATERMGETHVPCIRTEAMSEGRRKGVNIAFNRATNDLAREDSSQTITEVLHRMNVEALAASLPDLSPDDPRFYRCADPGSTALVPTEALTRANPSLRLSYSRNLARVLAGQDILTPLVCTRDLALVNGEGRLEHYAEVGMEAIPVVYVEDEEAELARAMLNLLSMDFDVHGRYERDLRHNSFRRARRSRKSGLGRGLAFPVVGKRPARLLDLQRTEHADAWKRVCGTYVCDFGAGHLHEVDQLRAIGVTVAAFEPYRIGTTETGARADEIDKPESLRLTRAFLSEIASGRPFDSVFLASVLNSVPFRADREHVVTICAALCSERTRLYVACSSVNQANWRDAQGAGTLSQTNGANASFALDYEPGITIGDFTGGPKVQKYHTSTEIYDLLKTRFQTVRSEYASNNVEAEASTPLPLDPHALAAALAFEFDLPYPDGSSMDLVREARAAFEARLGMALPQPTLATEAQAHHARHPA